MSWIPAFEIGAVNGWLFMIIYPLQWLAVLVVPKHVAERTGHSTDVQAHAALAGSTQNGLK